MSFWSPGLRITVLTFLLQFDVQLGRSQGVGHVARVAAKVRLQGLADDQRASQPVQHWRVDDPIMRIFCKKEKERYSRLRISLFVSTRERVIRWSIFILVNVTYLRTGPRRNDSKWPWWAWARSARRSWGGCLGPARRSARQSSGWWAGHSSTPRPPCSPRNGTRAPGRGRSTRLPTPFARGEWDFVPCLFSARKDFGVSQRIIFAKRVSWSEFEIFRRLFFLLANELTSLSLVIVAHEDFIFRKGRKDPAALRVFRRGWLISMKMDPKKVPKKGELVRRWGGDRLLGVGPRFYPQKLKEWKLRGERAWVREEQSIPTFHISEPSLNEKCLPPEFGPSIEIFFDMRETRKTRQKWRMRCSYFEFFRFFKKTQTTPSS